LADREVPSQRKKVKFEAGLEAERNRKGKGRNFGGSFLQERKTKDVIKQKLGLKEGVRGGGKKCG